MDSSKMVPLRILSSPAAAAGPDSRAAVEIYRPFFAAGILTVLTAGCLLGAIALFGIGRSGSYTISAWTPYILAHANSQLFGWVGFFVMGFALQQHAPSVRHSALFHRLAYATLGLMGIGIGARFVAEPLAAAGNPAGIPLGVAACSLQAVAVGLFFFNTFATRHRSGQPLAWPTAFVFLSLFWLLAVAIAEPFAFLGSHQASKPASILFVAEWFPPLREAQFLGFVAMMIFGVSLTKFSTCFGARPADRFRGLTGLAWWTVGLLLRMGGWLHAFRSGFAPQSTIVYFAGGVCLAIGAVYIVGATGIFARLESSLRAHKFLRAAYGWLLVSGLLAVAEYWHLRAIGQPFSHAYTGAIRHAVTVGFISQMIVGVGTHVIRRMNDLDDRVEASLWPTFWLLNVGNCARVALEIATDYTPAAFAPMGVTGFVELAGLALWGVAMARSMFRRSRPASEPRSLPGMPYAS